ncbi:MAG: GMC family oxidoreductase N-terminal domain-containing protein, partial [Burkholderiales bacterium]|nr:GMC family oxidoreductase N-terminal domain-containing protein [Burkholderiales bacterium]
MTATLDTDLVIVGAGSAGCVLAHRLSARQDLDVTLLEAGGADEHPWIRVPLGYARTIADPRVNWCYTSAPVGTLDGRTIAYPLGRTLGGSSAINGLVWLHGHPADYACWAQAAGDAWAWPAMRAALRSLEAAAPAIAGDRGRDGPQPVSCAATRHPRVRAALASAAAAGLPIDPDPGAGCAFGIGPVQVTVRHGQRVSAAHAFLRRARSRPNLRVLTGARVHRIALGDGRATGVEAVTGSGGLQVRARRGVVLAAGVVHSPQLLMLSGIGPPEALRSFGLEVRVAA